MSKLLLYLNKNKELLDINNNLQKSKTLTDEDVVYFCDHYNSLSYESLKQQYGKPKRILFDVECTVIPQEFEAIFIPAMHMGLSNWIHSFNKSNVKFSNSVTTNHCCNFSINRKHYDRHLVLKLIEEVFSIVDVNYTWHGKLRDFDLTFLLEELNTITSIDITDEFKSKILSPICLPAQWLNNSDIANEFNGAQMIHGSYVDNWKVAHKELCTTSAVCLLTESFSNYQKNYTFTEKTLYGILGLNFLIWAGNYGQADVAKKMGIDIFEDVIDHSYQYENTIFERCYFAIQRNLDILTNLELATELRNVHLERLIANRDYMLKGGFEHWIGLEIIKHDLQSLVKP